jgi:AcrR family transcriptional regulator
VDLEEDAPVRRRRGAELEAALLEATWDELVEHGYGALTIDAVAQRAETSRTVVYRRWATKSELAEAAIAHMGRRQQMDPPDTGSLRGDLLAVLRFANARRLGLTALIVTFMGGYFQETGTTPADMRRLVIGDGPTVIDVVIDRAIERGEVSAERMTPRVRNVAFDLMRHDALMTLASLPDEAIVEIVDQIFLPLALGA